MKGGRHVMARKYKVGEERREQKRMEHLDNIKVKWKVEE